VKRPSAVVVLVVAGVAGLIGLLAYGVASEKPDRSIDDAVARGEREPAPEIELPPLEGGPERSLADWRGQVVILNYWASWCEPCRKESPLLERWHKRISKRNATVLGVDVLDVTSDAQDFIDEYGLTYPHLRDKDGSTLEDFGIIAYPETFVIDRQGRIADSRRGPVDEEFLRASVLPLLGGES
jgi:cytochrome c biogenesis protein CcmG/thiol:disulfide interchange protein DsbE